MLQKYLMGLLTAVLLTASPAFADAVAKNESGDYVRLSQQSCPASIAATVPEQVRAEFRAGIAHVGGKDYKVCWVLFQDQVLIKYDDGDEGIIPANAFKVDPGV